MKNFDSITPKFSDASAALSPHEVVIDGTALLRP